MTIKQSDRAKRFGKRLADGPAFTAHQADWVALGIKNRTDAALIEQHFRDQYFRWSRTWMLCDAYHLAPKLRDDPGFLGTLSGAQIAPHKNDE